MMDTKNLQNINTTNDEDQNKKSTNLSRFRLYPRNVQNVVLVWLDLNVSDALDDEHRDIIKQVRSIINDINVFSDVNKCVDFLHEMKYEKAFMIVSGGFGQ